MVEPLWSVPYYPFIARPNRRIFPANLSGYPPAYTADWRDLFKTANISAGPPPSDEGFVLEIYQGADLHQDLTFFADDAQTDPLVFTTPTMQLRHPDGSIMASFNSLGTGEGSVIASATPGVLTITMGHVQTAALVPGMYATDIFATVEGYVTPIAKAGDISVLVISSTTKGS